MNKHDYITIVSGLPRSGTSMMMKMLHQGGIPVLTDGRRSADKDNPQGYYEFERVKTLVDDTSWLHEAVGKAVKMVSRYLFDLPDTYSYKIVFMQRELSEILASQKAMLERKGKKVEEKEQNRIHAYYKKHLVDVVNIMQRKTDVEVLYVKYNDIVETPEEIVPLVNQFLDNRCDKNAMLSVVDKNLYRQRN